MIYFYLLKNQQKTLILNQKLLKKPYITANCDNCKRLKSKFVSINQIKGNGFLSNLFRSIPNLNRIF